MRLCHKIALLALITVQACSQDMTSDDLTKEFLSGKLFVFNSYALHRADSSFFRQLIKGKMTRIEHLDSISGKTEYGTFGAKGVLRIKVEDLSTLKGEEYSVVDGSVFKHFDDAKHIFYFIDGVPNTDPFYALDGLVDKKIKEIRPLAANQAEALWGSQGKNGALIINTEGKIDLTGK